MKDITSSHKPCLTVSAVTAKSPHTHLPRKIKTSVHECLKEMWVLDNFKPLAQYLCVRDRLFCFTLRILDEKQQRHYVTHFISNEDLYKK